MLIFKPTIVNRVRAMNRMLHVISLLPLAVAAESTPTTFYDDGDSIIVSHDQQSILRYNYKPFPKADLRKQKKAPAVLKRSGYIHPVWTPEGRIVSEAFPETHYHHLGVWGAWVNAHYQGVKYDFWNLKKPNEKEQITFTSWASEPSIVEGSTQLEASHVYTLKNGESAETVLEESLRLKIARIEEGHAFDYTIKQKWLMDEPLELPAWRYGGMFAWRYPSAWEDNSLVAVSSEKKVQRMVEKEGIDATRARWLKVEALDDGYSVGILLMSHPDNFRHPEPTRLLHAGRGKGGYIHFTPIREEGWQLLKGDTHVFKFRAVAYDGILSPEEAETLWKEFAQD